MSVALIEAEDFASGTSSKSTKLIHGGLRYLAMGHIHVVREAARERKRVYQLAPHLAEPKWLMVPAAHRIELLKYAVGISIYERLGQVTKSDSHFSLSGSALAEQEPLLDRSVFPHACVYREYLTDDARLVIANVRAGILAGAIAVNRMKVTGFLKDYSRVTGVRATCELTGEEILVKGKVVINAAGPWVEDVCQYDGLEMPKSMVLSKGIHIVVPLTKLPVKELVFTVAKDNRPVFVIPRGDVVYIGTTDSEHKAGPELWPRVSADEVKYLFEPVQRYFGVELKMEDCLTSWAGLRPLIHEEGKATKEISRRDEVWVSQSGLVTIAGGKLTGYRKMAEDTVAEACKLLGSSVPALAQDVPLPGGEIDGSLDQYAAKLKLKFNLKDQVAERLVRLYGGESEQVLGLGQEALVTGGLVLKGEIYWAVEQELALTLEDVLYRRTRAALYQPRELAGIIEPAIEIMGDLLGWNPGKRLSEIATVQRRLKLDGEVVNSCL